MSHSLLGLLPALHLLLLSDLESINSILFDITIIDLILGHILGLWSVACCFRITMAKLSSFRELKSKNGLSSVIK